MWLPISEITPEDKKGPILGWCVHDADPYFVGDGGRLTLYGAHCEGMSHVEDGPNVLVWGGGFSDVSYEEPYAAALPDWWFLKGSGFEVAAFPTHFQRITPP